MYYFLNALGIGIVLVDILLFIAGTVSLPLMLFVAAIASGIIYLGITLYPEKPAL